MLTRRSAHLSLRPRRALAFGSASAVAVLTRREWARRRAIAQANWQPPAGRERQTAPLLARQLGDDGPIIVLLHGLGGSSRYWGATYDRLGHDHRVIVPDLLGFGRSPRPAHGYGLEDHAGAVLACIDELYPGEQFSIGAHSLGTLVALQLAANHPERVTNVVAFGPPLYPDQGSARRHVGATSPMSQLFVLPGPVAERTCRWVCDHRELASQLAELTHPSLPPSIAADAVQHTWESYSETLKRTILANEAPALLDKVRCRVRLIAGDHDKVVDRDFLQRLAETHDNLTVEIWRGGHELPLAHAGKCVRTLLEADKAIWDRASGPRG